MTRQSEIMDVDLLQQMIQDGYVRARTHPADKGLFILNYTEKAQYERVWNDVTRTCRGLIVQDVRDGDGLIVARPWPKFFNYGELEADSLNFEAPVSVQDKMDGSLGILYCDPEAQWSIATRGSFESDQAIHATAVYRDCYEDYWAPKPGFTYLFEIIYPENRIVLDYGQQDDLVLLDILETATGETAMLFDGWGHLEGTHHGWPGPVAERMAAKTLTDALALPDRPNREGLVVTFGNDVGPATPNVKLKLKQEDYVRLHKLVTGLNERAVWEHLSGGGSLPSLVSEIPDEFHEWVTIVAENLWDQHDELQGRTHAAFHGWQAMQDEWGEGWTRKEFALWAREQGDLTPLLFQMLDGRDISPAIWKTLRPRGETKSLLNRTEDNA